MELAESSGTSTPPEREPVMNCRLVLTTLSGVTINVSLSIAKFDRLEDLEDHVMDCLVSVTDLKVFRCSIEFLHLATQTYLEDPIWDKLRKTSLPICVRRGGSQMWVMATHWAKVDLRRTVISVHMRLTSTSRLQFSQARGQCCESRLEDRGFQDPPRKMHLQAAL